jgi:FMN phosphatase YigB (HAD superfamily)
MRSTGQRYEVIELGTLQKKMSECSGREELFSDVLIVNELERIFDEKLDSDATVFSLDVFDTLLVRDNSSEYERFIEFGEAMANSLADDGITRRGIDCFLARYLGTHATYRASRRVMGAREGSLEEIHATSARLLGVSDEWSDVFVKDELEVEAKRTYPNKFLIDYVLKLKGRGNRVILLSDMYFHGEHISELLRLVGVNVDIFDEIYSSGDYKLSKASGQIFNLVASQMNADSFFHIGDSFKSDFMKPIEAGWDALHIPVPQAEIQMRKSSHDKAADWLLTEHEIKLQIQRP